MDSDFKQPFRALFKVHYDNYPVTYHYVDDMIDNVSTLDELLDELNCSFGRYPSLKNIRPQYTALAIQLKHGHSVSDSEAIYAI